MLEQTLIYGLLIAVVFMLQVRKVATAVKLLALQSLILTVLSIATAISTETWALLITAALTLVIKTIVIPLILHYTIVKIDINRLVEPFLSRQTSFALALILIIISYFVTSQMNLPVDGAALEF